ncbi:MAG: cytochrome c biogenesis protein CcsA [Alphaproteobacteria bacterium]|nr:cytochrome c biogenesis protein CcsA [Alphaproteobacteria bacterium]
MRGLLSLVALLLALLCLAAPARAEPLPMEHFARIPVQEGGRVKPLDSFARDALTRLSGRDTLEGMPAIAWLAELLLDQERAYARPRVHIPNPEVATALELPARDTHRYSFRELSDAVQKQASMLRALLAIPERDRTLAQNQLADLQLNLLWVARLSHAVSLIQPQFILHEATQAEALSLSAGVPFSYLDMMERTHAFVARMDLVLKKKESALTDRDRELIALGEGMRLMAMDSGNPLLAIIPPQWGRDGEEWASAWSVLEEGRGSPRTSAYLALWQAMAGAYTSQDTARWADTSARAQEEAFRLAEPVARMAAVALEYQYDRLHPFPVSLALYALALACAVLYVFAPRARVRQAGLVLLSLGAVIHGAGIIARVFIMARPPVATLYESIVFVALIAVVGALLLERRRRDGLGLTVGGIVATLLQSIGMRYAADGETMGMLAAVLNTNFWLATHVVTITIGYGCALVTATLAHLYLLRRLFQPTAKAALTEILRTCQGVGLVALFFAALGTILGGIWADQSWGRFWGWDPKENGALLLVLWLSWLFHGQLAGILRPLAFAAGMAATAIVVALAWFGVNLLAVGLHSYGFTEHIAQRLAWFCGSEILFLLLIYFAIRVREQKERSA